MPELPEVETVRQGIAPFLEGERLMSAVANRPDLRWPFPERFAERLKGRQVLGLRRRSKYLLIDLDAAPDPETWIVHLGMSGRFVVLPKSDASPTSGVVGDFVHQTGADDGADRLTAHDHVVVETPLATLVYNDPRRFGAMDLWPTETLDDHKLLAGIGPEPLGNAFHADHLASRFEGRSTSVKAALLDQRNVAGLGNIYVCEALYRSKINPKRAAGGLSRSRIERLVGAVRNVLQDAIDAGGSSLRDYRQADGALGYFQHSFAVYGREGDACAREDCDGVVRRVVQTGRSSFYCPVCQR